MIKGHQPKGPRPKTPPEGGPQIETEQTRAAAALAEQVALSEDRVEFDPVEIDPDEEMVEATIKRPDLGFKTTRLIPKSEGEAYQKLHDWFIDAVASGTIVVGDVEHRLVPVTADPELRLAPLYAALAKAQGAFPEIPKNRTATIRPQSGKTWEFKYSDLSDLINATRPALSSNGLAVFQVPDDKGANCITTLAHASGLTLVGSYPIKHKDGDRMHPGQTWAVSWAFARRYGMSALLGIAAEETIEGDQSNKTNPDFEAASGDGVLTVRGVVVPEGATKTDKARLYAEAIETQMQAASTPKGLDGVWSRNEEVINALQDHAPDNYANLIEAYEQTKAAIGEE